MEVDMPIVMTAQDREWQAQDDARTLSQATIIYGDPSRLERAQKKAEEMAKEKREEANAMGKVAGSKRMPQKPGSPSAAGSGSTKSKIRSSGESHNVFKKV